MIRHSPHHRTGFSLVECLATLTVLILFGMAAAKMLSSVTSIGLQTNQNKMARAAVQRLANRFRADVASAQSVVVADVSTIKIQQEQQVIIYRTNHDPIAIDRSVQERGKTISADRFALTQHCEPVFGDQKNQVRLRLTAEGHVNPWIIEVSKP